MHVAVGDSVYDLRTIGGKLVVNGETSASVVDHDRRVILVSDCVPVELRMHVAAQAVSEAWAHELAKRPTVPFVGTVG